MKKIVFALSLILIVAFAANAQVSLGIKGGLNFANIDAAGDPSSKTGYHFGSFAEIGLGGFNLQPEVLFSVKGAEDFDLSYLEVPVLFKKDFAKVLNVHIGPQFGFLTSAKAQINNNEEDVKEFLKSSDLSAVFGAGLNLPMGLVAGGRYVLGLSDINDQFLPGEEIKNKTFQVYVGYKFN